MKKTPILLSIVALSSLSLKAHSDTADLDDIKLYDIVKVEQCLDQAYDTV